MLISKHHTGNKYIGINKAYAVAVVVFILLITGFFSKIVNLAIFINNLFYQRFFNGKNGGAAVVGFAVLNFVILNNAYVAFNGIAIGANYLILSFGKAKNGNK